jgi:hypothetical protein
MPKTAGSPPKQVAESIVFLLLVGAIVGYLFAFGGWNIDSRVVLRYWPTIEPHEVKPFFLVIWAFGAGFFAATALWGVGALQRAFELRRVRGRLRATQEEVARLRAVPEPAAPARAPRALH